MPPTSGMQAIAAAMFEGKPVEVDFGPSSGPGVGGGDGGIGSWSGMIYIHKMKNALSSNLAFAVHFHFRLTHYTRRVTAQNSGANERVSGQIERSSLPLRFSDSSQVIEP